MSIKCVTCRIEVENFIQHVKEDWHTYNMRRGAVNQNPVSLEDFRAKQKELVIVAEPKRDYQCCNKKFKCQNTYENHLKSNKHIQNAAILEQFNKVDDDEEEMSDDGEEWETEGEEEEEVDCVEEEEMEVEEGDEEEKEGEEYVQEPLILGDCLFCSHKSKNASDSLTHMLKKHRFELPLKEYLKDEEGLLGHLLVIIGEYHACVNCDKQFYDLLAVRNHMLDLNHIQLNTDSVDYAPFYADVPQPISLADAEGCAEAELPNGKMIGNRLLFKYFKQNLNGLSNSGGKLAIMSGAEKARQSLVHLGGCRTVALAKPGLLTAAEKKQKSKEARYRQFRLSRYSNFQAHFRLQILM